MSDPKLNQFALLEAKIAVTTHAPMDAQEALKAFKRGFARAMMKMSGDRPTKAAESCGLYRNTFNRWLNAGKE